MHRDWWIGASEVFDDFYKPLSEIGSSSSKFKDMRDGISRTKFEIVQENQ